MRAILTLVAEGVGHRGFRALIAEIAGIALPSNRTPDTVAAFVALNALAQSVKVGAITAIGV